VKLSGWSFSDVSTGATDVWGGNEHGEKEWGGGGTQGPPEW